MRGSHLGVGSATDVGKHRQRNEDCFRVFHGDPRIAASGRGSIFAVADGLGGHRGGAEAARMAVDQLWLYFQYPAARFQGDATLTALIRAANRAIWQAAQQQGALHRMGCTLSALHIDSGLTQAFLAHVGDSRIYRCRGGILELLTQDHTDTTHRHVLTNHIGLAETVMIDTTTIPIEAGDRWLICSDGLHNGATARDMTEVLASPLDAQQAADGLIALAAHHGMDNATAIVVDVLA